MLRVRPLARSLYGKSIEKKNRSQRRRENSMSNISFCLSSLSLIYSRKEINFCKSIHIFARNINKQYFFIYNKNTLSLYTIFHIGLYIVQSLWVYLYIIIIDSIRYDIVVFLSSCYGIRGIAWKSECAHWSPIDNCVEAHNHIQSQSKRASRNYKWTFNIQI